MLKKIFLVLSLWLGIIPVCYSAVVDGTSAGFVTVAPTDNPAGSGGPLDTYSAATKFTAPASGGTISSMGWWCDNATEADEYQLGIYSHDAGNNKPNLLLASSGDMAKGTTAGWKTGTVAYGFTGNTVYWLAAQLDDTATVTNIDYTTNASYKEDYRGSSTELLATWGTSTGTLGRILSIYALYTSTANIIVGTVISES